MPNENNGRPPSIIVTISVCNTGLHYYCTYRSLLIFFFWKSLSCWNWCLHEVQRARAASSCHRDLFFYRNEFKTKKNCINTWKIVKNYIRSLICICIYENWNKLVRSGSSHGHRPCSFSNFLFINNSYQCYNYWILNFYSLTHSRVLWRDSRAS